MPLPTPLRHAADPPRATEDADAQEPAAPDTTWAAKLTETTKNRL